jgi:hypothetical protein
MNPDIDLQNSNLLHFNPSFPGHWFLRTIEQTVFISQGFQSQKLAKRMAYFSHSVKSLIYRLPKSMG